MNLLTRIVTPAFITFNAHCWFAYAIAITFPHGWVAGLVVMGAAVKEFYVDKHFELDQSFLDDLRDFVGYCAGVALALAAVRYV